jgi:small-conductance mechanosensitive channel
MVHPWIQFSVLEKLLQWEIYFLLVILGILAFGFYKFFLLSVNFDRHRSLRKKFRSLFKSFIILSVLFVIFELILQLKDIYFVMKVLPYVGLLALTNGCVFFIQVCRLFILMYFFLTSMRTAVPILLVNIFTLILSLMLAGWVFTSLFGIQVGPLLATSAAFSIILGLALQDTLGNLFAGISLQLDNVFEIGNWVEIIMGSQKITGQISEISWRSVILIGVAEEVITIPNRIVAQSQISNWTRPDAPIIRAQGFRIAYSENLDEVKSILRACAEKVPAIKRSPQPVVFISEMNESWILVKVVYYIDNFGAQFSVGDELIYTSLNALKKANIKIASTILELREQQQNPNI